MDELETLINDLQDALPKETVEMEPADTKGSSFMAKWTTGKTMDHMASPSRTTWTVEPDWGAAALLAQDPGLWDPPLLPSWGCGGLEEAADDEPSRTRSWLPDGPPPASPRRSRTEQYCSHSHDLFAEEMLPVRALPQHALPGHQLLADSTLAPLEPFLLAEDDHHLYQAARALRSSMDTAQDLHDEAGGVQEKRPALTSWQGPSPRTLHVDCLFADGMPLEYSFSDADEPDHAQAATREAFAALLEREAEALGHADDHDVSSDDRLASYWQSDAARLESLRQANAVKRRASPLSSSHMDGLTSPVPNGRVTDPPSSLPNLSVESQLHHASSHEEPRKEPSEEQKEAPHEASRSTSSVSLPTGPQAASRASPIKDLWEDAFLMDLGSPLPRPCGLHNDTVTPLPSPMRDLHMLFKQQIHALSRAQDSSKFEQVVLQRAQHQLQLVKGLVDEPPASSHVGSGLVAYLRRKSGFKSVEQRRRDDLARRRADFVERQKIVEQCLLRHILHPGHSESLSPAVSRLQCAPDVAHLDFELLEWPN